jgi:peptide/nickel transport system ATP-binding protein
VAPLLDVRNLSVQFSQSRVGRAFPSTRSARSGQALPAQQPSTPASQNQARWGPPAQAAPAVTAVRDLSFSITPGEVLGLVGESGSGKSVTALAIMGLLPPGATISGSITFHNSEEHPSELTTLPAEHLRHLRGARIAMIFQEPMTALNPVMRVGDQIAEAVLAHGVPTEIHKQAWDEMCNGRRQLWNEWYRPAPVLFKMLSISLPFIAGVLGRNHSIGLFYQTGIRREKAYELAVQALRDVAIPEPDARARSYPHQLSGGMRQRVMIAMAIVNRPQLLIADEPTTALDVTIQQQILDLLNDLRHKFSLAMLFISHDLAVVSHVADRVAVMYAGNLVELASKSAIFTAPAHPYTQGLLRAIPTLSTDRAAPLATIEGTVPAITALPPGCPFEPRCPHRVPTCTRELPPLVEVSPGHLARCPVMNE